MGNPVKKILSLDDRGRITLPPEMREDIDGFALEILDDGTFHLIPHKSVPVSDLDILKSLKISVDQFKKGKTKKIPDDWIE